MLRIVFLFFNDTATTEIYTLSLHDALPISAGTSTTGIYIDDTPVQSRHLGFGAVNIFPALFDLERVEVLRGKDIHSADRKSTRLNSSHLVISYAVFCLQKKHPNRLIQHRQI